MRFMVANCVVFLLLGIRRSVIMNIKATSIGSYLSATEDRQQQLLNSYRIPNGVHTFPRK